MWIRLLKYNYKIFLSGTWVGGIDNPVEVMDKIKLYKRNGILPIYLTVYWDIKRNEIQIFTDSGRLIRPIFYIDKDRKPSYHRENIKNRLEKHKYSWNELTTGFLKKLDENYNPDAGVVYTLNELYGKDITTQV